MKVASFHLNSRHAQPPARQEHSHSFASPR